MLPRLIDDKRRRRRLITFTLFSVLAIALFVGWIHVRSMIEQRHNECLVLLQDLQAQAVWLEGEMNMSRDAKTIENMLGFKTDVMESQGSDLLSSVTFILRTRKAEYRVEAQEVAGQCSNSLQELANLKQRLSSLMEDGSNVVTRLKKLASSKEAKDVVTVRYECSGMCGTLQQTSTKSFTSLWDCEPVMSECRRYVDYVLGRRQKDLAWRNMAQEHLLFVAWTNDFTNVLASYDAKKKYFSERFQVLKRFPFDRDDTIGPTQKRMSDEIQRIDRVLSFAKDVEEGLPGRVDEELAQFQKSACKSFKTLSDWQTLNGDFVNAEYVNSVSKLSSAFESRRTSWQNFVSEHLPKLRIENNTVKTVREAVGQTLQTLKEEVDNGAEDERLVEICERGNVQLRTLLEAENKLLSCVEPLTNCATKVQADAKTSKDKIDARVKEVQASFPDWDVECKRLIAELNDIKREVIAVKTKATTLQKSFLYYRDNNSYGTMSSLRERVNSSLNFLTELEKDCVVASYSPNGKELRKLMQRRDKAKQSLELEQLNVSALEKDVASFLVNGTVVKVKFLEYRELFSAQLQQGIRHFDFALDLPRRGSHRVEIRFSKGGRYLYKMSPQRKHKIVLQCKVSGRQDWGTQLLSWEDTTSSWNGKMTLEGDFDDGINDIILDLTFKAENIRGEVLQDGTWQYQCERGLFSSELQDNFGIEFWVDGNKQNVLWGVPVP